MLLLLVALAAVKPDGTLLEQKPFVLPAWEVLPATAQGTLAREDYRRVRDAADLDERELNEYGYRLLGEGRAPDAAKIFELNVAAYPQSSNAHDSLGEAYAAVGRREQAIRSYAKALALDPRNESARAALAKLQGK